MKTVIQMTGGEAETLEFVLNNVLTFVSVVRNSPEIPELKKAAEFQYESIRQVLNLFVDMRRQ